MVDPHAVVLSFLETRLPDVTFYAGRDVPPPGYSPGETGDAITFRVRGGDPDYDDALFLVSLQFKCYSTSAVNAYLLYGSLYDALHNAVDGDLLHAESETFGQPLEEPGTEWPFTLTFFKVRIRQTD